MILLIEGVTYLLEKSMSAVTITLFLSLPTFKTSLKLPKKVLTVYKFSLQAFTNSRLLLINLNKNK